MVSFGRLLRKLGREKLGVVWRSLRLKIGNIARLLDRVIGEWYEAFEGSGSDLGSDIREARRRRRNLCRRPGWGRIGRGGMEACSSVFDALAVFLR